MRVVRPKWVKFSSRSTVRWHWECWWALYQCNSMHTSWSVWPLMFSITLTCYPIVIRCSPYWTSWLMYIDTQWYQMQYNTCMHAWLPRISNKIEWTIPVTYWWWFFILDVILFCLQLFSDHDACSKEPGTFRIVKKDVEERCYLVEVRSSSQMLLLLLSSFCHVLPFQSSWSIEATIWWRLKWRFVADPFLNRHVLDSMLNYVIWRYAVFCHVGCGNPQLSLTASWVSQSLYFAQATLPGTNLTQQLKWFPGIKGGQAWDTCIVREVASFSKVMTQGISKIYALSAKIYCIVILIEYWQE